MKKETLTPLLLVFFLVLAVSHAGAQSNQRIDELLGQSPAQKGHAAYLVLTAAGIADESVTPQGAFQTAVDRGLLAAGSSPADELTFGELSYLLMESFGIPGGVMYRIFPGPRYASREVIYRRWARLRRPPGQVISGDTAVRVVSVYLNSAAAQGGAR